MSPTEQMLARWDDEPTLYDHELHLPKPPLSRRVFNKAPRFLPIACLVCVVAVTFAAVTHVAAQLIR